MSAERRFDRHCACITHLFLRYIHRSPMRASSRAAGQEVLRWLIVVAYTAVLSSGLSNDLLARRGVGALIFAVVLNLLLCGWALLVFDAIPLDLRGPRLAPFFRLRPWERSGRFYRQLGVLRFQSLLPKHMPGKKPPGRDLRTNRVFLQDMELATRHAELAHALCFLALVPYILGAARLGNVPGTLWLLVNGLAWHVYPVLLQRYNRPRWQRLLTAVDRSKSSPAS